MKKLIFVISFMVVSGFLFGFTAPEAKAQTIDELQVSIQQLQTQIAELQEQLQNLTPIGPAVWCHDFNVSLKIGDSGSEVTALQTALTKEGLYTRKVTGVFDEYTASAVVAFQEKYVSEVLAPWGLTHGTGYVGPTTRAKLNKLYGCGVVKPYIKVLSPNGGETWTEGSAYKIIWDQVGLDQVKINIELWGYEQDGTPAGKGPYRIATDVSAGQEYYNWTIPSKISGQFPLPAYKYKVGLANYKNAIIVDGETINGDKSDNYFSIVAAGANLPPVIDGLTAPTQLKVNETGTWTIKAHDPENGPLTYSVNWGDKVPLQSLGKQGQTTTFTHSYSNTGTYTIEFTVTDDHQKTVKTSTTVEVVKEIYIVVCGDVTGDGNVNKDDVTLLQNYVGYPGKYTISSEWASDVTCDGKIDMGDVVLLLNHVNHPDQYQLNCCDTKKSITVTSPNGGEKWVEGNTYKIIWGQTGLDQVKINIELWGYGQDGTPVGKGPYQIATDISAGQEYYNWTIPSKISEQFGLPAYKYKVGLANYKNVIYVDGETINGDKSDNYFSITKGKTCHTSPLWSWDYCSPGCQCSAGEGDCDTNADCTTGYCAMNVGTKYGQVSTMDVCEERAEKSITVISPNGGEKWVTGKTYEIQWKSEGIDKVDISLCGQIPIGTPGNCLPIIAEDISVDLGKYSWTIPSAISPKDGYRIRIFDGETNLQDDTNGYFSIVKSDCHTSPLWSWDYCSPGCQCSAGEGDCDTNADCTTGYCAMNVGTKYGQVSTMDVCEKAATTITCKDSDGGRDYFIKGTATRCETGGTAEIGGVYIDTQCIEVTDTCVGSTVLKEYYCENELIKSVSYTCSYGCKDGACQAGITVISPDGGEKWTIGKTYDINWASEGTNYSSVRVNIYLWKDAKFVKTIALGVSPSLLSGSPSIGKYSWTVPSGLTAGDKYQIRIYASGIAKSDISDGYFSIVSAATTCTDSDGGKNYYLKGSVLGKGDNFYDVDYCINTQLLREYYCQENGYDYFVDYTCPSGCKNGACLKKCTDSDGGKNYYTKGTVTVEWPGHQTNVADFCSKGTTLYEGYCKDGDLQIVSYNCLYGCSDGVCVGM